jgi:ATP-binding cassette subfamily B protein
MPQEPQYKDTGKVTGKDIIRFTLDIWQRRKWSGFAAVALMMVAIVGDVLFPVYSGGLVDALSRLDPKGGDWFFHIKGPFLGMIVAFLLHSFGWYGGILVWNWFSIRNLYDIVTEATAKVQRFSADWHANSFAGATVRKITRGMWSFDMFADTLYMGFLPSMAMLIAMTAMLLIQVPLLGMVTIPLTVIFVAGSVFLSLKILRPRFRLSAAADTEVGASLADLMTGVPTVKSFAGEAREDARFRKVVQDWRQKSLRAWETNVAVDFLRHQFRLLMMIVMLGTVVWLWQRGQATSGDMVLAITAYFILTGYLREIGRLMSDLMRSSSEIEDVVGFWLRRDDIADAPDAKPLDVESVRAGRAGIEFRGVSFCYHAGARKIYDGLSVAIRPGERVALVGASGSGKSTFVKLIQRLYDVESGEVLIGGQNVALVAQESLRRAVALVPQDPILFHRTLAENIAYGKPGASLAEIEGAAREAYAHDFIEGLPLRYDTLVGERGIKLSGGERQRVAIARAILADCPILIMDEATSSLDSVSEHVIQKALDNLMAGRTTITIAHRLATIRKADRILVFYQGKIVEEGTHEVLLANPESLYRRLYEMQALDLIADEAEA